MLAVCAVCHEDRSDTQLVWLKDMPEQEPVCSDCLLALYEEEAKQSEFNSGNEQTVRSMVG